jgi:hypothetical protein
VSVAACQDSLAPTPQPLLSLASDVEALEQTFLVTTSSDAGPGSLRQAIEDANAAPGRDGIAFAIPGAGPHVIQVASQLPVITDPVVIDGYSQPGAAPNTNATRHGSNAVVQIVLDGSLVPSIVNGMITTAPRTTIRGLAIHSFDDGIIVAADDARIEGSFIGTNAAGTEAGANRGTGVRVLGAFNTVGGSSPADRNVVSGHPGSGILITNGSAVGNRVEGNYVGLDATGTASIPNGLPEPLVSNSAGIHITGGAAQNVVGGPGSMPSDCDGPCNVVSGNNRSGVWIEGGAHDNVVQGNLIGVPATGTGALGNNRWGVILGSTGPGNSSTIIGNRIEWNGRDGVGLIAGSSNNAIGGLAATPTDCGGVCNIIAFNGQRLDTQGDGVRFFASAGTGNAILGNSIYGHPQGLGIDFAFRGVTFNDPGDFDEGANRLQNFPVLTSASSTPGRLAVRGVIDTPDPQSVTVELFANPQGTDPTGFGEGGVFIGRTSPDADGSFSVELDGMPVGTPISATATDANGNTSEFSASLVVSAARGPDTDESPSFLPFSFSVAMCTEVVNVSGSFHENTQFIADGSGGTHFKGHINAVGIGVGQTTGGLYNWNDVINQEGSFRGPQETFTSMQSLELIGRGSLEDARLRALFHVTVTPQGVVNITVDRFEVDCN